MSTAGEDAAATRAALAAAERELAELRAARSEEMARLERQTYWLERWHIDLDGLTRRRPARALLGVIGGVLRALRRLVRGDRGAASAAGSPGNGVMSHEWVRPYFGAAPAPLAPPSPVAPAQGHLHIAWIVPPFRRGSGGHMTIFTLAQELERAGHSCSVWVHDPERRMHDRAAVAQRELADHFVPLQAGIFDGFADWQGADVAFATGWQTAYPLWTLPGCKLKAYLVQDFEPDFYPASAERLWAEETYRMGYACVAASRWLAAVLAARYGAAVDVFELGVDLGIYRRLDVPRRDDTVVFYARRSTPRRATELGLLALAELVRRRPGLRVVLFGDTPAPPASFPHEYAGVLAPESLARLYNEATAGLVISLSNYSRMPKEMMACGLPVVDVRHPSVVSAFGGAGEPVIELAEMDLVSIADRLEALLDDRARQEAMARSAAAFVAPMTWQAAAEQIEAAVRRGLEARVAAAAQPEGRRSASR